MLIPDLDAGCSLADSITADQLRVWQAEHPGALTVMYVNTSAEVKALTDYCCTSSNAVAVVEHIYAEHGPDQEILFGPDMFLGAFVERRTGRPMHVWLGECHVHAGIRPSDIEAMRASHPDADFLIHPECGCSTSAMEYVAAGDISAEGVQMLSTGGMLAYADAAHAAAGGDGDRTAIVATETGHALRAARGGAGGGLCRRQRGGGLQVHEDDHAAEAARLPALRRLSLRGARAGRDRRRVRVCRSSGWCRSPDVPVRARAHGRFAPGPAGCVCVAAAAYYTVTRSELVPDLDHQRPNLYGRGVYLRIEIASKRYGEDLFLHPHVPTGLLVLIHGVST